MSRAPLTRLRFLLFACLLLSVALFTLYGGDGWLETDYIRQKMVDAPMATGIVFVAVYVLGIALSLPLHGVLAILSGVLFGALAGAGTAVAACSIGGTLAYLLSRFLLYGFVRQRFPVQLELVDRGLARDGMLYLVCLRMQPVIPFWVQNLLLGVTDIQLPRFVFGTVAGILPVTAVLANVGAQLNDIEYFAIRSVFTPQLLLALSLLALTPLLLRLLVNGIRRRMRGP